MHLSHQGHHGHHSHQTIRHITEIKIMDIMDITSQSHIVILAIKAVNHTLDSVCSFECGCLCIGAQIFCRIPRNVNFANWLSAVHPKLFWIPRNSVYVNIYFTEFLFKEILLVFCFPKFFEIKFSLLCFFSKRFETNSKQNM
jgi:hypothetical protein